jgi:hypothetical protein
VIACSLPTRDGPCAGPNRNRRLYLLLGHLPNVNVPLENGALPVFESTEHIFY